MLEIGKAYRNNDWRRVEITSQIKDYSADTPWLVGGTTWYDELSGRAVITTGIDADGNYLRELESTSARASISDHQPRNAQNELFRKEEIPTRDKPNTYLF
tara:strand:+ start:3093 stop:3395 length:303 start_codon:yes stop_codon:yes gene_type:complete